MKVIKLGGSLERCGALQDCLLKALGFREQGVVVVPGGGDFAEQVRLSQQRWAFDDQAAHEMAILAMRQMARLVQAICRDFTIASTLDDIVGLLEGGNPVVWAPDVVELNRFGIPASWEVTSDSLAAWLAERLKADELILVKSAPIRSASHVLEYVDAGVVDPAFPRFTERALYKITIVDKDSF
ncbi:MAG: hypothetical protein Kow0065_16610 [Methylomicrobium sp.]